MYANSSSIVSPGLKVNGPIDPTTLLFPGSFHIAGSLQPELSEGSPGYKNVVGISPPYPEPP